MIGLRKKFMFEFISKNVKCATNAFRSNNNIIGLGQLQMLSLNDKFTTLNKKLTAVPSIASTYIDCLMIITCVHFVPNISIGIIVIDVIIKKQKR